MSHNNFNKECKRNQLDPICFPLGSVPPVVHIGFDKDGNEVVCPYSVCTCPPKEEMGEEAKIQQDLDSGKFGMICSNETTFKNYVFPLLSSARTQAVEDFKKRLVEKMPGKMNDDYGGDWTMESFDEDLVKKAPGYNMCRDQVITIIHETKI